MKAIYKKIENYILKNNTEDVVPLFEEFIQTNFPFLKKQTRPKNDSTFYLLWRNFKETAREQGVKAVRGRARSAWRQLVCI